jgi:peptidoglycan/LPS O-acetylase OafA/YrhL
VSPSPTAPLRYIPALDGLRAIAALLVVFGHVRHLLGLSYADAHQMPFPWPLFVSTEIGVDLFFVLSGFLITSILFEVRARRGSMFAFWMRRALRIMPLHAFYVTALLVLMAGLGAPVPPHADVSAAQWAMFYFYLGNFAISTHGELPIEFILLWSLAVEEQFYILWPSVVARLDPVELLKVMVFCVGLAIASRWAIATYTDTDAFYTLTLARMDALMFGALIASGRRFWGGWAAFQSRAARLGWLPALGLILVTLHQPFYLESHQPPWAIGAYYAVVASCWAVLIMRTLEGGPWVERVLANRPIRFLGRISYGIYIWNVLVGRSVTLASAGWGLPPGARAHLTALVTVAATVAAAAASYYLLERPFLRLKERFPYFGKET